MGGFNRTGDTVPANNCLVRIGFPLLLLQGGGILRQGDIVDIARFEFLGGCEHVLPRTDVPHDQLFFVCK